MSLLPKNIHPSWDELLTDDFKSKLDIIENAIEAEPVHNTGYKYFPEKQNIMRFLSQDLNSLKYIIVGMEPYPSWYTDENNDIKPVATGRSFEIANVTDWCQKFKQSSLRNMLKTVYVNETGKNETLEEIREHILDGTFNISKPHDWFSKLEQQGVLFLNATLTVKPDVVDSHMNLWKDAMNDIIRYINDKGNVKWLLFGDKAKARVYSVIGTKNCMSYCHPRLGRFIKINPFGDIPDIKWYV